MDPANRAHEPWVLAGVSFLHHPLHAEQAIKYILPSLQILEEIQLAGDMFFHQRWLDAILGGHPTPDEAAVVREFLDSRGYYSAGLPVEDHAARRSAAPGCQNIVC